MALTVIAVAIAVVLSSTGCLVEEEKPSTTKVTVPDDRKDAKLVVDGLVINPLFLTLQQVVDLGAKDFRASNTNKIGAVVSGNFTGVLVSDLLGRAGLKETPYKLELEASDGYKAGLPASNVTPTSYLAFKEEGKWLTFNDSGALRFIDSNFKTSYWVKKVVAIHVRHGVPDDRRDARLVVDGLVGKSLNWTLQQVVDAGLEDFSATFVNSVGTTITSNFTGVKVRGLLTSAAASATAEILEVEASDGYKAVIFLSDVSNTTYLTVKEEGAWNNLTDTGALRLVDTHMTSVYWVKKTVALHLKASAKLELYGPMLFHGNFTAGFLHKNGTVDVKWKEGSKNRTARGMPLADVLGVLRPTSGSPEYIELVDSGTARTTLNASAARAGGKDFLAADSKGKFVYVHDGTVLVSGLSKLGVVNGFPIFGNVLNMTDLTKTDLDALPGPTLQSVVEVAGQGPNATMVQVGTYDFYGKGPLNVSIGNLSGYTIVQKDDPTLDMTPTIYYLVLVPVNPMPDIGFFPIMWIRVI
jgi:DMSO/TMAO reductase YedYZ molybdopterin-dependent catalytic subunit